MLPCNARLGDREPARRALHELHAELGLERRDAPADLVTASRSAAAVNEPILGCAIGRPELPDMQLTPEQALSVMIGYGFSPDAPARMAEIARWLSAGTHAALPGPVEVTPTTLEDFAPRFAEAFAALAGTAPAQPSAAGLDAG